VRSAFVSAKACEKAGGFCTEPAGTRPLLSWLSARPASWYRAEPLFPASRALRPVGAIREFPASLSLCLLFLLTGLAFLGELPPASIGRP